MGRQKGQAALVVAPVYVNGTTVMQAIGPKGAYVVAVDSDAGAIGFHSKYADEKVVLPALHEKPGAFAEWLLSREDLYGAVVVPTDDFHVRDVAEHHEDLAVKYRLAVAPREATMTALTKDRAYAAVKALGYATPAVTVLGNGTRLEEAAERIGFPAILKPAFGIAFQQEFKTKVFVVDCMEELEAAFARARQSGHEVMLMEIVPGPDENLAICRGYASDSGEIRQTLTSVKLTSYPPRFGIGQAHESRETLEIVEPTLALVRSIGYRGALFNVEWKKDARDGTWKFIEFNCRSVASIGLARLAGCDVLDMMWRDKMCLPQAPLKRIKWGVRYAHLKNALLLHAAYPKERPTLGRYWRIYRPPVSFYCMRFGDMGPFVADVWPVVRRRFGEQRPHARPEA
jgi:predicted ATP-grasp superfamily ATP-dependent carboligase